MSPVDRRRYPADWKAISHYIRFIRAKGKCEFPGCNAEHGKMNPFTGSKVVLTTAHLEYDCWGFPHDVHNKLDCSPYSLLALCQLHHLRLDGKEHAENAAKTRAKKKLAAQDGLDL